MVGDLRQLGGAAGRPETDIFRTNSDVDAFPWLEPVERGDVERQVGRDLDRAAAVCKRAYLAGTRFTNPMKSATMRFAGWA